MPNTNAQLEKKRNMSNKKRKKEKKDTQDSAPPYEYEQMKQSIQNISNMSNFTPKQNGKNKDFRHGSADFPIIEIENGNLSVRPSSEVTGRKSGMDETFMTSKYKFWKKQDNNRDNNKFGFIKGFNKSRVRSNEILHLDPETDETTGHTGTLYDTNRVKQGGARARTAGTQPFHKKRQKAIETVIADETIDFADKPKKALIAGIKSTIQNTIGYNSKDKPNIIFRGFTASGLDLSNTNDRELALKSFQASRDSGKILLASLNKLVIKDEDLENPQNLDNINEQPTTSVAQINQELADMNISPIRCNTPFSQAFIDHRIEEYNKASTIEEKLDVRAKPTPFLRGVKSAEKVISRTQANKSNHRS